MSEIPTLEPLSLRQTRTLLESLGASPSKQLGQNFLIDKNIVLKSIRISEVNAGDSVVEIGPGLGTFTRALLARQCQVFAVELDTKLFQFLSETFSAMENFHIIQGDAVRHPLAGLSEFDAPFKVVANLPYNISTSWMDAVLNQQHLPISMTLVLQKEVGQRFLARCGSKQFSAISIFMAAAYDCSEIFPIARTSFSPAPQVDSVILHLMKKEMAYRFHPATKSLIRKIFTQRRKQIQSTVKTFALQMLPGLHELLEKYKLQNSLRPEQLSLPFWLDFDAMCARRS